MMEYPKGQQWQGEMQEGKKGGFGRTVVKKFSWNDYAAVQLETQWMNGDN